MPSHRGPHPEDPELFAEGQIPRLRAAIHDLSWLRTRGYGDASSLKLVGDRYRLRRRQRNVVARSACSDDEKEDRTARRVAVDDLANTWLEVDGFNVLIRLEGARGGAYIFRGRDEAYRDVDPVAGTYRLVQETTPAIRALRRTASSLHLKGVRWWLDAHVSNVGRLQRRLESEGTSSMGWEVCIESDVDVALIESGRPVATSDSEILNQKGPWCAIEPAAFDRMGGSVHVLDLRPEATEE